MSDYQRALNPEEIDLFANTLLEFTNQMTDDNKQMRVRLNKLGQTWRDPQFQKFSSEFQKMTSLLIKFIAANEEIIPKLKNKAARAKEVYQ